TGKVQQLRTGDEMGYLSKSLVNHRGVSTGSHEHEIDRSQRSDQNCSNRTNSKQGLRGRPEWTDRRELENNRGLCLPGCIHCEHHDKRNNGSTRWTSATSHFFGME